jgi:hypothetical protein
VAGKITQDDFINRVKTSNEQIEVLGIYINSSTKVSVRCLRHNIIFDSRPSSLYNGHGCPECWKERITSGKTKYTKEEFADKLKKVNSNIEIIGEYHITHDPIEVMCKIHNVTWKSYGNVLLRGIGCKECRRDKCSKARIYSKEKYVEMLNVHNPNVEIIGKYIGMQQKTLFRCKICGNQWKSFPGNILRVDDGYNRCPKCSAILRSKTRTKSQEKFVEEVRSINKDVCVIGTYENSNTPIRVMCTKCNHIWSTLPYSLLIGCGCPVCISSR